MKLAVTMVAVVFVTFACSDTVTNPSRLNTSVLGSGTAATESRIDTAIGHGGASLSTTMTGAAEAPFPGDPDGSGVAHLTFNPGQGEVCFHLEVSDIAPATASHIHEAPVGQPGDVVVTLTPPPTSGSSTACVSAGRELILEILKTPEAYYVNVHNAEYPAGAVRGQLSR